MGCAAESRAFIKSGSASRFSGRGAVVLIPRPVEPLSAAGNTPGVGPVGRAIVRRRSDPTPS
jgi:hypothetical protein